MFSLKDLRNRMAAVRSTQKITKAMQMVAASRLRRAQDLVTNASAYSETMTKLFYRVTKNVEKEGLPFVFGMGKQDVHLLIVCAAERGLCGAFNSRIIKKSLEVIKSLQSEGKQVKIITVGKKAKDLLSREYEQLMIENLDVSRSRQILFTDACYLSSKVIDLFKQGVFDQCSLIYASFKSLALQVPVVQTLVPAFSIENEKKEHEEAFIEPEYEIDPQHILENIVPSYMAALIFRALLENAAGEMSARMMAMDNATRNAGDMLRKFSIAYNSQRQAQITRELIEIISGAESL